MVNEQAEPRSDERAAPAVAEGLPAPPPLVILASDDEAVCIDDLCLPPDTDR